MPRRPERLVARTMHAPCPLADLVMVLGHVVGEGRWVYLERHGDRYRWSPAHRGGAYPLLREVAAVLHSDHARVGLSFADYHGWCVVPGDDRTLDARALVHLEGNQASIARAIDQIRWRRGR